MITEPISGVPEDPSIRAGLVSYLLELGDDRLVLGERLAAWCGHGPMLEEDIALANLSLDLIGQASFLLNLAGRVEDQGRNEDRLAFFRDVREYRNCLLVEQPRGDFAFTIVRQLLFSTWADQELALLSACPITDLAGIAQKAHKENRYHLRHAATWLTRLGLGTPESRERTMKALDELWRFHTELAEMSPQLITLASNHLIPDRTKLLVPYQAALGAHLEHASLPIPEGDFSRVRGGRLGLHSEHLGHLLAEMQSLPRSMPAATW